MCQQKKNVLSRHFTLQIINDNVMSIDKIQALRCGTTGGWRLFCVGVADIDNPPLSHKTNVLLWGYTKKDIGGLIHSTAIMFREKEVFQDYKGLRYANVPSLNALNYYELMCMRIFMRRCLMIFLTSLNKELHFMRRYTCLQMSPVKTTSKYIEYGKDGSDTVHKEQAEE